MYVRVYVGKVCSAQFQLANSDRGEKDDQAKLFFSLSLILLPNDCTGITGTVPVGRAIILGWSRVCPIAGNLTMGRAKKS